MPSTLLASQRNPVRILNQVRMRHSQSRKLTLLVEGPSDRKFFLNWLREEQLRVEPLQGRQQVEAVWRLACKQPIQPSLICLVDLDYDQLLGRELVKHERFIYVSARSLEEEAEANDLEGVLVRSDALRKLFYEKLPEKILDEQEDLVTYLKQQREALRKAASLIGAYRAAAQFFYNEFHRGYWDRDALQIGAAEFLDPPTLQIQEDKLREIVVASALHKPDHDWMVNRAQQLFAEYGSGWNLCRGHDLSKLLALHLNALGWENLSQADVESLLRASFETAMVQQTQFGQCFMELEKKLRKALLR